MHLFGGRRVGVGEGKRIQRKPTVLFWVCLQMLSTHVEKEQEQRPLARTLGRAFVVVIMSP